MDTLFANLSYPTVKIEDNVDCIVDLEARPNCINVVERWYNEMNRRIIICTQQDNEKLVDDEMLFYHRSLKEKIISNKDKQSLASKILLHMKYFYLYYKENIHGIADTNYFKRMEDILVYYSNLELDLVYISSKQRVNMKYVHIIKRLCKVLGVYLHHRLKDIIHVLLRMSYNTQNTTCQMVMRQIFSHFLMALPQEPFSEEVFCRYYLVFERYKEVAKPEEKEKLMQYMFRKFNKTEDYLTKNGLMKTVLSPSCESIPDIVTHLLDSKTMAIQKYFDYLANVQNDEMTRLITNFNAQCVTNGYTNTSHELMNTMLQSEPLCIDSDSDIEAMEYQDTIVLSEDEEGMEITYRKKDIKPKRKAKIENNGGIINLDSDEESEVSVVLDKAPSCISNDTAGSSRTTVPTTITISDSDAASTSTALEPSVIPVPVLPQVSETPAATSSPQAETKCVESVPESVPKEAENKAMESSNQNLQSVVPSPSLSQSLASETAGVIELPAISNPSPCVSLLIDEDMEVNTETDKDSSLKDIEKCSTDANSITPATNIVKSCENSLIKVDDPSTVKDTISAGEKTVSILRCDHSMDDSNMHKPVEPNLVSASENSVPSGKDTLLEKTTLSEPTDHSMDDSNMHKPVEPNLVPASENSLPSGKDTLLEKTTLSEPTGLLDDYMTSSAYKEVKCDLLNISEDNTSFEKDLDLQISLSHGQKKEKEEILKEVTTELAENKQSETSAGCSLTKQINKDDSCMDFKVTVDRESLEIMAECSSMELKPSPPTNIVKPCEDSLIKVNDPSTVKDTISAGDKTVSILRCEHSMDDSNMHKPVEPNLVSASENNLPSAKDTLLQKTTLSEPAVQLDDYMTSSAYKEVKCDLLNIPESSISSEKDLNLQTSLSHGQEEEKEKTLKEVTTKLVENKQSETSAVCSLTEQINKDNSSMDFKVTVDRKCLEVMAECSSKEPKPNHLTSLIPKPSLSIKIPLPNVILPPQNSALSVDNSSKCFNLEKTQEKRKKISKSRINDSVVSDSPKYNTLRTISESSDENKNSFISDPEIEDTSSGETTNKLCDSTSRMTLICSVSKHINQDESKTDLIETKANIELEAKLESGSDAKQIGERICNEHNADDLKQLTLTISEPTLSDKKISKNIPPKVPGSANGKDDSLKDIASLVQKTQTPDLKVQLTNNKTDLNVSQLVEHSNDTITSEKNMPLEKDSDLLASYTGDTALSKSRNKIGSGAISITKNDSNRNYDGKAGKYFSIKQIEHKSGANHKSSTTTTSQSQLSKSAIVNDHTLKNVLPSVQLKCSLPLSLSPEKISSLHTFPPATNDATKIRIQFRDGKLLSTSLNSCFSEQSGDNMTREKIESDKNKQSLKKNEVVNLSLPSRKKTSIESSYSHDQSAQPASVLAKNLPVATQTKPLSFGVQNKILNDNKPLSQENTEPLLLPIDDSKSANIVAQTLRSNPISSPQILIPPPRTANSVTTSMHSVIPPLQIPISVSDSNNCRMKPLAVTTSTTLLQVVSSVESQPSIITPSIYKYSEFSPLQSPIPTCNSDKSQNSPSNVNLGLITPSTDSQSDGNPRYLEDFSDDERLPNVDFLNKISSPEDTNFQHFRKEIGGPFSEIDANDHINDYIDTGQIDIEDTIVQASVPTSRNRNFVRHVSQDNECPQNPVCDIRDTLPKATFEDRKVKKNKKALRNKHPEQTETINHSQNTVCTNAKVDFSEEFSSIFSGPVKSQFKNGQYYENGNPDLFNIADSVPPVHKIAKRANSGDSRKCGVTFGFVEIREIEPKKRKRNSYQKVSTIPKVTKGNGSDLLNKNSVTNHNTSSSVILHQIHFPKGDDRATINSSPVKGMADYNSNNNSNLILNPQKYNYPDLNSEFSNSPKSLINSEELQQCIDKTLEDDNLSPVNIDPAVRLSDNSNCYNLSHNEALKRYVEGFSVDDVSKEPELTVVQENHEIPNNYFLVNSKDNLFDNNQSFTMLDTNSDHEKNGGDGIGNDESNELKEDNRNAALIETIVVNSDGKSYITLAKSTEGNYVRKSFQSYDDKLLLELLPVNTNEVATFNYNLSKCLLNEEEFNLSVSDQGFYFNSDAYAANVSSGINDKYSKSLDTNHDENSSITENFCKSVTTSSDYEKVEESSCAAKDEVLYKEDSVNNETAAYSINIANNNTVVCDAYTKISEETLAPKDCLDSSCKETFFYTNCVNDNITNSLQNHGLSPTDCNITNSLRNHGLSPTDRNITNSLQNHGLSPTDCNITNSLRNHGLSPTDCNITNSLQNHGLSPIDFEYNDNSIIERGKFPTTNQKIENTYDVMSITAQANDDSNTMKDNEIINSTELYNRSVAYSSQDMQEIKLEETGPSIQPPVANLIRKNEEVICTAFNNLNIKSGACPDIVINENSVPEANTDELIEIHTATIVTDPKREVPGILIKKLYERCKKKQERSSKKSEKHKKRSKKSKYKSEDLTSETTEFDADIKTSVDNTKVEDTDETLKTEESLTDQPTLTSHKDQDTFNTHSNIKHLSDCSKLHERKANEGVTKQKTSKKRKNDSLSTPDSNSGFETTTNEISADSLEQAVEEDIASQPIPCTSDSVDDNEVYASSVCEDVNDAALNNLIDYLNGGETRLPFKKRKVSVNVKDEVGYDPTKEEISYPAKPVISIAEALYLQNKINNVRQFKTPAERKEMPPLPLYYNINSEPSPIITDQFNINNHTYNNPTINYHMSNMPMPFIPCGPYFSLPSIIFPFNGVPSFEQNGTTNVSCKEPTGLPQTYTPIKKENKSKDENSHSENYCCNQT